MEGQKYVAKLRNKADRLAIKLLTSVNLGVCGFKKITSVRRANIYIKKKLMIFFYQNVDLHDEIQRINV